MAHKATNISSLLCNVIRPFPFVFDSKKDLFLSNPLNKQRFINLLSAELKNHGISCINCEEDADTEVVKAAIMMSRQRKVTVWADDADITVLLIHKIFEEQDGILCTQFIKTVLARFITCFMLTKGYPRVCKSRCSLSMLSRVVTLPHQYLVMGIKLLRKRSC